MVGGDPLIPELRKAAEGLEAQEGQVGDGLPLLPRMKPARLLDRRLVARTRGAPPKAAVSARKTHAPRRARHRTDAGIEPDLILRHRRANLLAGLAMLLQVTALFLAWWVETNTTYGFSVGIGLWSPAEDVHAAAVHVTAALAVLALPLLFLRVAARSLAHEPAAWRRDVAIACALMAAALASCWAWPIGAPFWGSQTFAGNATLEAQQVATNPGIGWWVSLAALLLAVWAFWWGRPLAATTEK